VGLDEQVATIAKDVGEIKVEMARHDERIKATEEAGAAAAQAAKDIGHTFSNWKVEQEEKASAMWKKIVMGIVAFVLLNGFVAAGGSFLAAVFNGKGGQ